MENKLKTPLDTFQKRNKFFSGVLAYFVFSVIIYIACRLSVGFANFVSQYPSAWARLFLAGATSIFPFSVAEGMLFLLLPVSLIFLFFAPDRKEGKYMTRNAYIMLGVLLLVVSLYLSVFAPCYFRTPIEDDMNLDRTNIKKEEILNAATLICEEISLLENDITTDYTGKSLMPLSYTELVSELNSAYDSVVKKYDFISDFYSHPKPLAISGIMPYTRISGFYTFFTGEANVSTAYPDFMLPFTMAHEMAHQRGIAREDEANFVAFLVCIESDNPYIKYSGYTETINYLLDSLYTADPSLFETAYYNTPSIYKKEYSAYVSFMHNTTAKSVSNVTLTVNNSMLQIQGQDAGTESYNLMTELAVAYFSEERNNRK